MEALEESTSNQEKVDEKSDNDKKKKDNSLKENVVQETLPKKKFANTNFALKMKNKRKEEKLNSLDTKETLSSCKEMSIDVTRLNSNPVPKIINAVENKMRKKKRSQWKMGVMKKKKKPLGKDVKLNPLSKGLINGVETAGVKKEEPVNPASEKKKQPNTNGESSERRKSLRSTTSSISESNACELENKGDAKVPDEAKFSCRRTEPFVGKLLTKEARDEIVSRILKGETETKVDDKNETDKKDVPSDSKEGKDESLSESNKKTKTNDEVVEKGEPSPKPTVMDTEEKVIDRPSRRSAQSVMDTEEKVINQPSRKSASKIVEAKESVGIEESSCSRTMPFVGKTIRKLAAGVPEIEIDSSTNQSDEKSVPKDDTNNLNSSAAADKTELIDSPKDINANAESTLGIKILSVSSLKDDDVMRADFLPDKVNEQPVNEPPPVAIPPKDSYIESDSSNKVNTDVSANKTKAKSKSTKSDAPIKSGPLSEKADTTRKTRRSSSSVERRTSLRSNVSVKSDGLSEEFDSKSSISEDVPDFWSCQRVVPFRGKTERSSDKPLVAEEEAPNQTEAPSTVIGSVPTDDLTAPPESASGGLVSEDANHRIPQDTSQNEVANDVTSRDGDQVESAAEPLNNSDTRSSTGSPVLNGEWKFRRKRQILSSDDESQDKEIQKTKKYKVQSDAKKLIEKKTPLPSPRETICSFLSSKCTKHDHQNDMKPNKAYVLLTRLEDEKDPKVRGYFVKTANAIKKNYRRIMINKDTGDTLKTKSDGSRSVSTSTQATKHDLTPPSVPEASRESDSSCKPSQDYTSSQSTETIATRRRASSRASSGSPILQTKRRKRPVNYLEEFSDTDEDNNKLTSQSRGPTLRDRDKFQGASDMDDENDMEVEEFSRVGRQNSPVDFNQEHSDESCLPSAKAAVNVSRQARCKSVAEKKISDAPKYPTRSKTPHVGMSMDKSVKVLNASEIDNKKLEEDLVQGLKSMEETINKEMKKRGLIPPGTSEKTLSRRVSNEQQLSSTPNVPSRKSMTPKKILQNDIASPRNGTPNTPRRSVTFQRNELLSKVTKSASELLLEADRKKETKIKDVRVQLIKLEAVCSDYKDYSAGEIELLTNKYIDMLMNSNFACDTWRVNPIKLATSYNRTVDMGDEGDSDVETRDNEPLPFEEVQVPMDSVDVNAQQNESPRRKSLKKSSKQPGAAESANASSSRETSLHEKTFGAINISEVLSQPAAEEDAENARPNDSNAQHDANDNSIGQVSDAILVNGTQVHACTLCHKIFVEKDLLQKHIAQDHSGAAAAAAKSVASTSRSTEHQAPGPASSKRAKSKKLKNNNSSLQCTVCSETFATKEVLFDHIMTHNEQQLQEAYKAAKLAKLQERGEAEDEDEEQAAKSKKQKKKTKDHRKSTDSTASTVVSGEELAVDDARAATSLVDVMSQQAATADVPVAVQSLPVTCNSPGLTVCQCHVHELTTQDLHIEMVLLCTSCNVIYRRRECFEVHFRNNAECRQKRSKEIKSPKLFCSSCRFVMNSLLEMRAHLEQHAQDNCTGTVTFLCNICKVAFFGVGGIFYSHWFTHAKRPDFVGSRHSFPKLSVVSVLEDVNGTMTTSKSQEGFFYIAEHVCKECRLPFSSDPELKKHNLQPCQPPQPAEAQVEPPQNVPIDKVKLICDLCKMFCPNKDQFDNHCNERNHLKTPITKFSRLPVSNTEQVFVCSLCRGLSKTLDEMKEHWKRVHSPIMELYTCKTCNVVPSNDVANYTYEKFESHCRMVHANAPVTCLVYFVTARYVCNICKFGFETEKSMKEHELVHQKKTATQSSPVQNATAPLPPTQTATFYVADNLQADGGRRLHPVVLQYPPNINGTLSTPMAITQLPNQPQFQLPGQINQPISAIGSHILLPPMNVVRMPPNATAVGQGSSLLQNALQAPPPQTSTALAQEQPEKVVETIELDSRSNSPVLDSSAASTSSSSNSLAAAKKAYMTKVNPNFENILKTTTTTTTTGNQENRDSTNTPNSDKSRRDENDTPAEVDTLTPQPFEVVLVTDELSENSDQDKSDKLAAAASNEPPQQQPEVIETKSFLRVRSVAELQSIKIHLCSMCGLNFDTPHALEQHERQHRAMGEVGRSTPVQMISPMVAPPSKETINDPHTMLMTQMKQKLALSMSNGPSAANANVNTRAMPNVLPHQPVLPPQQQQSWYPTTSNTTSSMASMNYAASHSLRQHHSMQQPPHPHSVLRQTINTAPLSRTGYTTVRPPPPYPSTSNTMVATGRPSAIQLPERSTTGNIPPQTKRPSGAATRIPQQSLQSYDDVNSRQTGGTVTYNTAPQQSIIQKTYGPAPNAMNYSTVNSTVNYQSVPQTQPRQPPPQKNIIYTCKHPNCFYRSASLAGIRAHETIHLLPQQGQQSQQLPTTSNNHQQQQQQQQPPRLLPVSQMPERTRHALPTSRPPGASTNSDKLITCRICELNCATSIELIEHVSTKHSGANQVCCYVCDYCPSPLIFDTEDQLRKHMNVSHNHSCELCNKRYPSKEDLMVHMDVHMRRA